jgi:hypothetical protein
MADLTIRHISPATLARLDRLAARQGKSKEEVASNLLEGALRRDSPLRGEAARRIRAMTPRDVPQSDSTDLIHQIRNE